MTTARAKKMHITRLLGRIMVEAISILCVSVDHTKRGVRRGSNEWWNPVIVSNVSCGVMRD